MPFRVSLSSLPFVPLTITYSSARLNPCVLRHPLVLNRHGAQQVQTDYCLRELLTSFLAVSRWCITHSSTLPPLMAQISKEKQTIKKRIVTRISTYLQMLLEQRTRKTLLQPRQLNTAPAKNVSSNASLGTNTTTH